MNPLNELVLEVAKGLKKLDDFSFIQRNLIVKRIKFGYKLYEDIHDKKHNPNSLLGWEWELIQIIEENYYNKILSRFA